MINAPTQSKDPFVVRTQPFDRCSLCGALGHLRYEGLEDQMLPTGLRWNIAQCSNGACGQMWVTPRVLEEDIGDCYKNYYTVQTCKSGSTSLRHRLLKGRHAIRIALGHMLGAAVMGAHWRRARTYYLESHRGRVLEVGSGAGKTLSALKALGWDAQGQDVDPAAARYARTLSGCTVHQGKLESLNLPRASFDAIFSEHVLEHVYDPISLLSQCRALLKPGGKLVVITPNSESFLHARFGRDWRDLDPPRHIQIFNTQTLSTVALRAGFVGARVTTSPIHSFFVGYSSIRTRLRSSHIPTIAKDSASVALAAWLAIRERLVHRDHSAVGEECVLEAIAGDGASI